MRAAERRYYDRRAAEYDEWWGGFGLFAELDRPGWHDEVGELERVLSALPRRPDPRRGVRDGIPDAASARRRDRARPERRDARRRPKPLSRGSLRAGKGPYPSVRGPELRPRLHRSFLPSAPGDGPRAVPDRGQAGRFGSRSRRLRLPPWVAAEEDQERVLNEGSRYTVYKCSLTPAGLAAELGGGKTLMDGEWFVVVQA